MNYKFIFPPMLSEFSPFEPVVEKEGVLSKLGGGAGGHKNWKDRYFVLADHLYYYNSKAEFVSDPQSPLGRVNLLSFYVSKSDPATHEFCVHSYPKVRSPGRTAVWPFLRPRHTPCLRLLTTHTAPPPLSLSATHS